MAYHSVLSTSDDFVNAMISAHKIADTINKELNKDKSSEVKQEVFPYRYNKMKINQPIKNKIQYYYFI